MAELGSAGRPSERRSSLTRPARRLTLVTSPSGTARGVHVERVLGDNGSA
jgi:hypothetical protein